MSSTAPASGPSLKGRFAAAIALTFGFYVLALALAGALLAAAIVPWLMGAHPIHLTLTAGVLGGAILYAIVPRRLRFSAPGLRVTAADHPRLFALIESVARSADEPLPNDVYLTMEVNAAVAQVTRTRRVLIIGVPLMQLMTEREFEGVLAHEFGHYSGGDTKLGPWIYRTRETIGRTIAQLSSTDGDDSISRMLVRQPFKWYGIAFLRITAAISRRQEFAADRFAVEMAGRAPFEERLRKVHSSGFAFDQVLGRRGRPRPAGGPAPAGRRGVPALHGRRRHQRRDRRATAPRARGTHDRRV